MVGSKNYYEILEIPTDASQEDIHRGYTRAKNAYSQDSLALYSLMTKEECDEILDMIEEAFTILSDPTKRRQYDDARGINNQNLNNITSFDIQASFEDNTNHQLNQATPTTQNSMSKIVAKKRFTLEFDIDANFEKEIEKTVEFTGAFLKKVRMYKNVDINRMADMTKVSKTYIINIEEEEFNKLPATVYVRGFVYQIAKCLKLNPELVANSFLYRLKSWRNDNTL
ncbi:helix-turn-helix domain-containing protein [Bacteriovoracaceae bacterium]|nr:helix-turn-helix domain-containing protein [Bacteriovoracaceae bacterium]